MEKSAIIIGGGLGGLLTGSLLAKEGLSVTVLEKNVTPGGGLQSFTRFGEVFDTGMHVLGGVQEGGNVRRVFQYLGIFDKLHLIPVDDDATDVIYFADNRSEYRMAKGRERYVETLASYFPDEKENLKRYVDALYRLVDEVDLFNLRTSDTIFHSHSEEFMMPASDFIAKYISDERLRSVVAYINTLYGGRREMTPAFIHAIISVLYINGQSRFAGGSVLCAETLCDFINSHGGRVITGDGVATVMTEGRLVTGVRTVKGEVYKADYYISAIHPCTLLKLFDDVSVLPKSYRDRLNEIPNSYSAFTVNIKLKPGKFRYLNHTGYYMARYEDMWNFAESSDIWPIGFLYMTPPDIDQGEFSTKMIITTPMAWSDVEKWENTTVGHRGEEYEAWKRGKAERLLDCMEEIYPGFRDCIEGINTASPLTIRDFYGVKEGSMYGFSKDCRNIILSQLPVVTKIPNLLLTGQNCNLHGFCGVTLTAINTCEAILGSDYLLNRLNAMVSRDDNRFDDMRPFRDKEINAAMCRITADPVFPTIAGYVFPDKTTQEAGQLLKGIDNVYDFQRLVMHPAIRQIVKKTTTEYTCNGMEYLQKGGNYLFVSNHRDIMLDASLLQMVLMENGLETSEITFGANLMQNKLVVDIGKSNKMFKVMRPGENKTEFYNFSKHLSDYIRTMIVGNHHSIWIANRNGRTKDGLDRTDRGILKMFAMSCPADKVKALADLNIVPISISYEWEPCDVLKAVELYASTKGSYVKSEGEDINSILTGIYAWKGKVNMEICRPVDKSELEALSGLPLNDYYQKVAELMDRRICSAYRLRPNNYIAHDLREGTERYACEYTPQQKALFLSHMSGLDALPDRESIPAVKAIFLDIYANPVDSKVKFAE